MKCPKIEILLFWLNIKYKTRKLKGQHISGDLHHFMCKLSQNIMQRNAFLEQSHELFQHPVLAYLRKSIPLQPHLLSRCGQRKLLDLRYNCLPSHTSPKHTWSLICQVAGHGFLRLCLTLSDAWNKAANIS